MFFVIYSPRPLNIMPRKLLDSILEDNIRTLVVYYCVGSIVSKRRNESRCVHLAARKDMLTVMSSRRSGKFRWHGTV